MVTNRNEWRGGKKPNSDVEPGSSRFKNSSAPAEDWDQMNADEREEWRLREVAGNGD